MPSTPATTGHNLISLKFAARLLIVEMLASIPTKMRDKQARRASRSEVRIVNAKEKPLPFFPVRSEPRASHPLAAARPEAMRQFAFSLNWEPA